jgi:RNA polymerase sigma-70 factor (ECF subfamily)
MATKSQEEQVADHNALIELVRHGDADAFEELYAMYRGRIYAICLRMAKNPAEAEDLVQEAFLQLFRKIDTFRGESQFGTWFHRLTVNVVLMKLRRKGGRFNVSLDELIETEDGSLERFIASTDHHLELSPERIAVSRAIEQLSPGYRLVLELHDIEGFEHNEIAEILGCGIGNSKSQLHKARRALIAILGVTIDSSSIFANFDRFFADQKRNMREKT